MSSAMNIERIPSLRHSEFLSFASHVGQCSLLLHTPRVVALSHGVRAAVRIWWKPNHGRVGLLLASFRILGSGLRAIANIRIVPSHTRHMSRSIGSSRLHTPKPHQLNFAMAMYIVAASLSWGGRSSLNSILSRYRRPRVANAIPIARIQHLP
jgi:hypothetical protein